MHVDNVSTILNDCLQQSQCTNLNSRNFTSKPLLYTFNNLLCLPRIAIEYVTDLHVQNPIRAHEHAACGTFNRGVHHRFSPATRGPILSGESWQGLCYCPSLWQLHRHGSQAPVEAATLRVTSSPWNWARYTEPQDSWGYASFDGDREREPGWLKSMMT